jgi:hypothetical protein
MDPAHRGDEHALAVLPAEGAIEVRQDGRRPCLVSGRRFEVGLGPRHEQGRGHALAGHVRDEEIDVAVAHEMVVEVPSDRACGDEPGRQPIRLARSARGWLRQHRHLDPAGGTELGLEPFTADGGGLQVLDVGLQRVTHVVEGRGERAELVTRTDLGQGQVEVSAGHAPSVRGQEAQRSGETARQDHDDEAQREEPITPRRISSLSRRVTGAISSPSG